MLRSIGPRRLGLDFCMVALLCAGLGLLVRWNAYRAISTARTHYIQSSRAEAVAVAQKVEDALLSMYANLRAIASLPAVRTIAGHDATLDPEARAAIEEIAADAGSRLPVTDIVWVPAELAADRVDPRTGAPEMPAVLVGHPSGAAPSRQSTDGRSNAALDLADFERLRQLQAHVAWLHRVMPTSPLGSTRTVPMLSGPEIVSGELNTKGAAGVRSSLVFSVPVYGPDQAFKGSVSASLRSLALRRLLPSQNYVVINPGYGYASPLSASGQDRLSAEAVMRGLPDPSLIYSDRIDLSLPDLHSNWAVWVGRPDRDFNDGAEARSARLFEIGGYAVTAALLAAGFGIVLLLRHNAELTDQARSRLEEQVAIRTAEIRHMAAHDPLTGAANRTLLSETMAEWLDELAPDTSLALMCIDLDRFKAVNDSFGHPVGDALLKAVTARIRTCIGDADLLARVGGDEFVVLHRTSGRPEASALGLAIVQALDEEFELDGVGVRVGASVGVALAPADGTDPDRLLANADLALYRAKRDGRGRCRFYEAGMVDLPPDQRCSEEGLRRAIANDELVLHYQPIVDARTEVLVGVEALVRWQHPRHGLVAPVDFIPLAEESGLILPLGDWVLRQACRDAKLMPDHVRFAVNVSAAQLRSPGFAMRTAATLAAAHVVPGRLELEITESRLLEDTDETVAVLDNLRLLGVQLALDDFGSGYSCFAHLGRFPLDRLKFDRAFMRELGENNRHAAIVRSVTSLCAELGVVTTAEGVETPAQRDLARRLGCHDLQGYLFGKPLALPDLLASLDRYARAA